MFRHLRRGVVAAVATGALVALTGVSAFADGGSRGHVYQIVPPAVPGAPTTYVPVPHAFATIDRDSAAVTIRVHDRGFPADQYSYTFLTFNNPSACTHLTTISVCNPGPDFNPATGFGVFPAAGTFTVARADQPFHFSATLRSGTTPASPKLGFTFNNPEGATIGLAFGTATAHYVVVFDPAPDGHEGHDGGQHGDDGGDHSEGGNHS